jgi:hypothetical protein
VVDRAGWEVGGCKVRSKDVTSCEFTLPSNPPFPNQAVVSSIELISLIKQSYNNGLQTALQLELVMIVMRSGRIIHL